MIQISRVTPSRWHRIAAALSSVLDTNDVLSVALKRKLSNGQSLLADALHLVDGYQTDRPNVAGRESKPNLNNGDRLVDRYVVRGFLGGGSMGEVYRAWDESLKQDVALKLFREFDGPLSSVREVRLGRQIRHPNVCDIYDMEVGPPFTFMTMECLDGETLFEELRRGRLAPDRAELILAQVLDGLEAAHQAGVIHGDLKPGNIFLCKQKDESLRVVLLDFGLSRRIERGAQDSLVIPSNFIAGTASFMPPEQIRGENLAPSADIHALGAVLFQCFTGRLPFPGETATDVMRRRLTQDAPPVRELRNEVPEHWAQLIHACLQADPKTRPQSAQAVRDFHARPNRLKTRRARIAAALVIPVAFISWKAFALRQMPSSAITPAVAQRHIRLGQEFVARRGKNDFQLALEEFQKATALAPRSVEAWNGVAETYAGLVNWGMLEPRSGLAKAKEAVDVSLRESPGNPQTLALLGYITSINVNSWLNAEDWFERALQADSENPKIHFWYAAHLGRTARHLQAISHLQIAIRLTPDVLALNYYHQLATEYHRQRDRDGCLRQALELKRFQPSLGHTHITLARAYLDLGQTYKALAALEDANRFQVDRAQLLAVLPVAEEQSGRHKQAVALATEFESLSRTRPIESVALAAVWAQLGYKTRAISVLNQGLRRGDSSVLTAHVNPWLSILRQDEDFQGFVRSTGWRATAGTR